MLNAWLSNRANWVCQRVAFVELCHTQAQQVSPHPRPGRFSTETPLKRERRLPIQREQRRRRRQQETYRGAEGTSLGTAKATPTTRDRGTGDWNQRHYDRFTLSKTQIS